MRLDLTLTVIDGPKRMESKVARVSSATDATIVHNGAYLFYDGPSRKDGIDVVHWKPCGFVAGPDAVTIAVTEVERIVWAGVL